MLILAGSCAVVIAVLIGALVYVDHRRQTDRAEFTLKREELQGRISELERDLRGAADTRADDLKAFTIRSGEMQQQMDRAARVVNRYAPVTQQRWIGDGNIDHLTDDDRSDLRI